MTAHEYHATYCRCGGANNRDVEAVTPVHVLPVNDLRDHRESTDCWCEPMIQDAYPSRVIVHAALDGRT